MATLKILTLGLTFGILAALFIGNVKTARIDQARELARLQWTP